VVTSDIPHLHDSDKIVETNIKNKEESFKKKLTDSAVSTSKNKGNHNILITGDSHVRACANKIKDNLHKSYNVTGIVKPGADIATLSNFVKYTVLPLGKNDVLIFGGGANNIKQKQTPWPLVRERTIPTDRPPLVDEI
jgi:hypothetical protein